MCACVCAQKNFVLKRACTWAYMHIYNIAKSAGNEQLRLHLVSRQDDCDWCNYDPMKMVHNVRVS